MNTGVDGPYTALKYEVEVQAGGQVALQVPFALGTRVVIFVVSEHQAVFSDLTMAAERSQELLNDLNAAYDSSDPEDDALQRGIRRTTQCIGERWE